MAVSCGDAVLKSLLLDDAGCSNTIDFCIPDFSLGKSNDLRVKSTVCYIVCGLVFRGYGDDLEVVLVQEAKEECYGKWYVPAGRVEPGETLNEAVHREVEEESGLRCAAQDIICVEVQGGGWYRITFFCTVEGGSLKKPEAADDNSVQGSWFLVSDVLSRKIAIRARDMLDLVKKGKEYTTKIHQNRKRRIKVYEAPVPGMFIQLVIVQEKAKQFEILLSRDTANKGHLSLPVVEYPLNSFVPVVISKFYRELLSEGSGVLEIPDRCAGVQCLPLPPREHDGLCLTLLCKVKPKMDPKPSRPERYFWSPVENVELKSALEEIMVLAFVRSIHFTRKHTCFRVGFAFVYLYKVTMTSVGGFSLIGVLVLLWVDLSKAFTELATTVPVGEAEMRQDADEIEDEDSQSWKIPVILISTVAVTVLLVSVTVIGCYMAYPYIKKGIGKRKPKEKILPDVEIAEKGTEQEEKEEEEEDDEEMPETTPGNEEREPSEKPVKQVRMQQTIIPAAPSLLSTKMDETQKSRKPPKMRKAPKPRMRNVRVDDAASLALSDRDGSGGFKSAGRFGKASSHTPQDTLPKPQAEAKGYQAAPEKWMAAEQLPEPAQTNLAPTVRVFHRP